MPVRIQSTYVHRHFSELSHRLFSGNEHFVVEKEGLPIMAILPIAEYQLFLKVREAKDKERGERLTQFRAAARRVGEKIDERGLTEADLEAQIDAARQELHQKRTHASNAE